GFPNISDNAEIGELIACGSHVILFATGRGSVVGSAISQVIKLCGNPQTYALMADDMDLNAGAVLTGESSLSQVGDETYALTLQVANGQRTKSEMLGHQEFILVYKSFEPLGPGCLPAAARAG
ncbi:MAG: UxaA family hydrolase, partial [Opitutaceae bacterium]|nr:UxaA family hydrolase [Opitutaceae bacterium]